MQLYFFRHGRSDKSLQTQLPHEQFEQLRPLVEGEANKAQQLGKSLQPKILADIKLTNIDLIHSGRLRSRQTLVALAEGLGMTEDQIESQQWPDERLKYVTDQAYWRACQKAIKAGLVASYADFFLQNTPDDYFTSQNIQNFSETYGAAQMIANMGECVADAVRRANQRGSQLCIIVSHEPVLSLFWTNLTEQSVLQLGGEMKELEHAVLSLEETAVSKLRGILEFRQQRHVVRIY